MLTHTPLCTIERYYCDDDGCDSNDTMMTMTMDANLCKYGENLLEGSKICWDTYPAAQEVAHNDFGHDANEDDDEDNNRSKKVLFVFTDCPKFFIRVSCSFIDGWTPHEL